MAGPALAVAGFLCVLAILAYGLLRHVYLAALTVAAPLCFLAALCALPYQWSAYGFLFGFFLTPLCTLLFNDLLCRSICLGAAPRDAAASALKQILRAVVPILTVYLLAVRAFYTEPGAGTAGVIALASALAALAISLAVGSAALLLDYPEDFIARANAARERRERLFERPAGLSETRWAFSVSGIALVIAAIAVSGFLRLHSPPGWPAVIKAGVMAVLLTAAFAMITRNWRLTLAATSASLIAAALIMWSFARMNPQSRGYFDLWLVLVPDLVAMSVLVLRMSAHIGDGEAPVSAVALTLREQGPATAMAFLVVAAITTGESMLLGYGGLADFMPVLAGLATALLFFPAFANTLYHLLPRYRSVDEVFGKR
jgi:hypothetical protein